MDYTEFMKKLRVGPFPNTRKLTFTWAIYTHWCNSEELKSVEIIRGYSDDSRESDNLESILLTGFILDFMLLFISLIISNPIGALFGIVSLCAMICGVIKIHLVDFEAAHSRLHGLCDLDFDICMLFTLFPAMAFGVSWILLALIATGCYYKAKSVDMLKELEQIKQTKNN